MCKPTLQAAGLSKTPRSNDIILHLKGKVEILFKISKEQVLFDTKCKWINRKYTGSSDSVRKSFENGEVVIRVIRPWFNFKY